MSLHLDTSALVRRYVADVERPLVLEAMAAEEEWSVSALCRTEAQMVLHRMSPAPGGQAELWRMLRDDWEAFWVVPIDDRCLARAAEIGAVFGVRSVDAIHLAAADRLPRPVSFLTFDRRQIPAAQALGFNVISPLA